jgi:hypothetical protein
MHSLAEWEQIAAERAKAVAEVTTATKAARAARRAGDISAETLTNLSRRLYAVRRSARRAQEAAARLREAQTTDLAGRASVAGIRLTNCRGVLFQVLEDAAAEGEVLLAEDICERARVIDRWITLSAIRRGLSQLRKAGLVSRKFTAVGTLAGYRLPEADATHPLPTPAELRAAMRGSKRPVAFSRVDDPAPSHVTPHVEAFLNGFVSADAPD